MIPKYKENFKYLLFFPAYLLLYIIVERICVSSEFHVIHCAIDDMIPFNELFVIPYFAWHVLIVITCYYTLTHETDNFRKLMKFFSLASLICFIIFIIYPSELNLRPENFARDNFLTDIVSLLYLLDTPTNVTPSMHIIGSLGLLFTSWNTRSHGSLFRKSAMLVCVIFVCASTLILKQHSLIDVLVAIPISLICGVICFTDWKRNDIKHYNKAVFKEKILDDLKAIALSFCIVTIIICILVC